jgi:hypothetical protein
MLMLVGVVEMVVIVVVVVFVPFTALVIEVDTVR